MVILRMMICSYISDVANAQMAENVSVRIAMTSFINHDKDS